MSTIEKQALIDSVTIAFAEEFGTDIRKCRSRLYELFNNYRVNAEEVSNGNEKSTAYLMGVFIKGKRASGMTEHTIYQYRLAIKKLEDVTGKKMSDVESEDINKFLIEYRKEVSSVTLRHKYQLLNSVYNYLFERKYIGYNPMSAVDAPRMTIVYKRQLTDLDLEKIKRECEVNRNTKESVRNTALIYFFISTGCRVSEVRGTVIGDVDFDKKTCKVLGKGSKERYVVLTDATIYRLRLYLDTRKNKDMNAPLFASIRGKEKSMTTRGIQVIVKRIREKTGVKEITCHTFRRYYATELRKRDVNIQIIAKSLGHANLNQINRYSLFTDDEMLDEIRHKM